MGKVQSYANLSGYYIPSAVLLRGRKVQEGDSGNEKKNSACQHGLPLKQSRDYFQFAHRQGNAGGERALLVGLQTFCASCP